MNFSLGVDESFLIKTKKRKTESEVDLCIICVNKKPKENVIKELKLSSIKNLLSISRERYSYGGPAVAEFVSRTTEGIETDIINKKEKYHKSCYRNFTTKVKKERAKDRYEDSSKLSDVSFVQKELVDHL